MKPLSDLIRVSYSSERLWAVVKQWQEGGDRQALSEELYAAVAPLASVVLRRMLGLPQVDAEEAIQDMTTYIVMKWMRKPLVFDNQKHCYVSMRFLLRERLTVWVDKYLKVVQTVDMSVWDKPLCLPIFDQVEAKVTLEDLPKRITEFVVVRDRFGFGRPILQLVTTLLLSGKPCTPEMLKNWFKVEHPDRCIAFVVLMARLFLRYYQKALEHSGDIPVKYAAARAAFRL